MLYWLTCRGLRPQSATLSGSTSAASFALQVSLLTYFSAYLLVDVWYWVTFGWLTKTTWQNSHNGRTSVSQGSRGTWKVLKMKKEKSGPKRSWIWTSVLKKSWKSADFWSEWSWKITSASTSKCNALMKQFCKYTYSCKCYNLCFLCARLHLGPKYCNYCYQLCCLRPEMVLY